MIIAPQAQFEESANDRGSRRCPLVGMLRESGSLIRDPLLRASSSGNSVSNVWKRDPADLESGSNLSVCPMSVFFFVSNFLSRPETISKAISRKNRSKIGGCEGRERRTGLVLGPSPTPASSVVGTLLKLRLRRHLPRGFILVTKNQEICLYPK